MQPAENFPCVEQRVDVQHDEEGDDHDTIAALDARADQRENDASGQHRHLEPSDEGRRAHQLQMAPTNRQLGPELLPIGRRQHPPARMEDCRRLSTAGRGQGHRQQKTRHADQGQCEQRECDGTQSPRDGASLGTNGNEKYQPQHRVDRNIGHRGDGRGRKGNEQGREEDETEQQFEGEPPVPDADQRDRRHVHRGDQMRVQRREREPRQRLRHAPERDEEYADVEDGCEERLRARELEMAVEQVERGRELRQIDQHRREMPQWQRRRERQGERARIEPGQVRQERRAGAGEWRERTEVEKSAPFQDARATP